MTLQYFRAALLAAALIFSALPAAAADEAKPVQDKPARTAARSTAITVEHEGTDSIGARLSTRLNEQCNTSSLFTLTEKDTPKMYLILTTQSEFAERPEVGSVYSLIWAYRQQKGQLAFLLARETGTINDGGIEALVNRVLERTDGLSVKYEYLWK